MNNLVLLRATDTPFYAEQSEARMQNNSLSSAMSLVSAGLSRIQKMVEDSSNTSIPPQASQSTTSEPPHNIDQ